MKKKLYQAMIALSLLFMVSCADNELDVTPNDDNFPIQVIVDADEGGDLADAEDYGLEIKFADFIGDLPSETITLTYELEGEGDFANVAIAEIIYEVEVDECTYERKADSEESEGSVSFDPVAKTITIASDSDLGSLPEAFEITFEFQEASDDESTFKFKIVSIESTNKNIVVGEPSEFEYEVLDNEVAGEWIWELESEDDLNDFKEVFTSVSSDLADLSLEDILEDDGVRIIRVQFEYGEMKFEIELVDEEEVCENGETENENKQLEIEADYDAEDGELVLEGSHLIINEDDGEIEDELDFIVEADYSIDEIEETITITFKKIVDEKNYEEGDELFADEKSFTFVKD